VDPAFACEDVAKGFVVCGVLDYLKDFVFKGFSENRVLFGCFDYLFLAVLLDDIGVTHSLNISETDFSFMKGPLARFIILALYSFFRGSSSTGCQSMLSQKVHSSSEISRFFRYSSNIFFFISSSRAMEDQLIHGLRCSSALNSLDKDSVTLAIFISHLLLSVPRICAVDSA
jgi:hypothetical protein